MNRVMVTGGAGYIGSVVVEQLLAAGDAVVIYDNLSTGHAGAIPEGCTFVNADLADGAALRAALSDHRIDAVVHMAASSLVGDSVREPAAYYRNNMTVGLALLEAMHACDVRRIVFSSSASVYGEPEKQPVEEEDATRPTSPYGETKLAFERALHWFDRAYRIRHVCLRYFNAAGASGRCGEDHEPETHLIPRVIRVALGRDAAVNVFGDDYPTRDGSCIRDYIHVLDLADAHVAALRWLEATPGRSRIYNLGCGGEGYTVKEVLAAAREVTGRLIPVVQGARRPGDPAVLVASSARIRAELGWVPRRQELLEIIGSAWSWHQRHPEGYGVAE